MWRAERLCQSTGEIEVRGARTTGAMNVKRPSCLLGASNELAGFLK